MSETVHIFATIKLKPEHFEKAQSAVAEIVPITLNELGCRAFALYTSQSDANTLHLFEMFESEDALAFHYAQDYTKSVFKAYEEWLAEPVLVQRLTPTVLRLMWALHERRGVIIGAGSGLSASIARRFFGGDEAIILAARTTENLSTLATSTGATCIQCDASKPEDLSALFAHIDDMGLSPSVLVYNAGAYVRGAVTDLLPEDVQRVISVNAFGAFLAARECAKRMKATRLGTMLFTGASAGIKGHANSSAFAMGKFALRGLCQSLARELAPQNIHVAHFVIDGLIHAPERGAPYDNREVCLDPDAVAETYFQISKQDKSAWTWEIELRPFVETF